jgi:hypothetical protein
MRGAGPLATDVNSTGNTKPRPKMQRSQGNWQVDESPWWPNHPGFVKSRRQDNGCDVVNPVFLRPQGEVVPKREELCLPLGGGFPRASVPSGGS